MFHRNAFIHQLNLVLHSLIQNFPLKLIQNVSI